MITVFRPYIYTHGDKVRLEAKITDEVNRREQLIWYEVEKAYSSFLCDELADAFLLAVIPTACFTEQDICIRASVSPQLLVSAREVHIPFYSAFQKKKQIQLTVDKTEALRFGGTAVATACSLGVDSMSAICRYSGEDAPEGYRLTHLVMSNCAHFGFGVSQRELDEAFFQGAVRPKQFADELGLPMVLINSNITDLMENAVPISPQAFHYYNVACVMALQKMLERYLFASSYDARHITIDPTDASHTEAVIVPLMGNQNMDVVLVDPFVPRTEKTAYISRFPIVRRYLSVCTSEFFSHLKNGATRYSMDKHFENCGWCGKCLRTLLTLDILGEIDLYKDQFDLKKYRLIREKYIKIVIASSKHNVYMGEIYDLMVQHGWRLPLSARLERWIDPPRSALLLYPLKAARWIKKKLLKLLKHR